MANLIILVGLPGSGKSTYAKKYIQKNPNTIHLSSDVIRYELFGDETIQHSNDKVFGLMHKRTVENLSSGVDVIYDATNVSRKDRRRIISIVNPVKDVQISCHIVWAPWGECVDRDLHRSRQVGFEVIKKFLLRWESPFYDEGITEIKLINTSKDFDATSFKDSCWSAMNIPHENPHHRADVDEHCSLAFEYGASRCANKMLLDALQWHDVGKPIVKFFKKDADGNVISHAHYYSHHNVGGYIAYGLYGNYSEEKAIKFSWLICNHMEPFFNSKYYQTMDPVLKSEIDFIHECDLNAH